MTTLINITFNSYQRTHFLTGLACNDHTFDLHTIMSSIDPRPLPNNIQQYLQFFEVELSVAQINTLIDAIDSLVCLEIDNIHYISPKDTQQCLIDVLTCDKKYDTHSICL